MSSTGDKDERDGEGKPDKASVEKIRDESDGGEGANKHKVEKDSEEGKQKHEESRTNTSACEPVKTVPRQLPNLNPIDNKSDPTLADKSLKNRMDKNQLDLKRVESQKRIDSLYPGTKSQSGYFLLMGSFLVAAVAVACVAVAIIYLYPPEDDMKTEFDLERVFENGLQNLQFSFTNQTRRFWKILRSRGLAHLRNKDPPQPLVFLLAAPPAAHEYVDCLATKLAEILDPRHKKTLTRIYGEKEKANPPEETKMTMDNFLKKEIEALHRVVLIHHLELLPPPSQLLFHSYCDDQNAPNKHLAFIFTVHMAVEPSSSLSPEEAEGRVEKYLLGDVWAKDDKDAIAALLVRIADTVVLMNGETSDSARAFCS